MANYKKEYWNESKTKGVVISRTPNYDGGYNYFLTYITLGMFNMYVINETYQQKDAIFSERKAVLEGKKLIGITA